MSILELVVGISGRIVDGVDELFQFLPLGLKQETGLLVPPAEVDVDHLEGAKV